VVRKVSSTVGVGQPVRESGAGEPADPDAPSTGQGRGAAAMLTTKTGHNRFSWDYRWSDGGPLVAPGTYTATLAGMSKTFEVVVDPGVLGDGISVADLIEQQNFLLAVRETQAEALRLRARVQSAMQKAGVSLPAAPGAGELVARVKYSHPLQGLWARIETAPGSYQQGMLLDQLANIMRAEGSADQKIGAESRRRFGDLVKELKAIDQELRATSGL
jgi:hypothetical protein